MMVDFSGYSGEVFYICIDQILISMKKYTNGEVTVTWDEKKCIHSGNCVRSLSSVFNPKARPWVNMEGGSSEEIMKAVDNCPSKALTYTKNITV